MSEKEKLQAFTLRMGHEIEEQLGAAEPDARFVLIVVKRIKDAVATSMTASTDADPQRLGKLLHDFGRDLLRGANSVEVSYHEREEKDESKH